MDIDATLEDLRDMVKRLEDPETQATAADAVVDLFGALDKWISLCGYLPMAWKQR